MSKQITIGSKPSHAAAPPKTAEDWVMQRQPAETEQAAERAATEQDEPMKRLTIDVSAELHARIKSQCALRHVKMNDEIRMLLDQHFPPAEA